MKSRVKRSGVRLLCDVIGWYLGVVDSIPSISITGSLRGGFSSDSLAETTFETDAKRLLSSKPKKKLNLQNLIQNQNLRFMPSKPKKSFIPQKNFVPQKQGMQAKNSVVQEQANESVLEKSIVSFLHHNGSNDTNQDQVQISHSSGRADTISLDDTSDCASEDELSNPHLPTRVTQYYLSEDHSILSVALFESLFAQKRKKTCDDSSHRKGSYRYATETPKFRASQKSPFKKSSEKSVSKS